MSKLHELVNKNTGKGLMNAMVVDEDNGDCTLFSYYTAIVTRKADGRIVRIAKQSDLRNGELSRTTALHLKHFCGMTKEEFNALPFAD